VRVALTPRLTRWWAWFSLRVAQAWLWWTRRALPERWQAGSHGAMANRLAHMIESPTFAAKQQRLKDELTRALRAAWTAGALAGFTRRQVLAVTATVDAGGVMRRLFAGLLGTYSAMPSEMSKTYNADPTGASKHFGVSAGEMRSWGTTVSAAPPLMGLGFALAGDGLIRTMRWLLAASAVGVVGVAWFGVGSGLAGFIAAGLMMSIWDASTGPLRARYDGYFPAAEEFRRQRAGQYQSGFKIGQMVPVQLVLFGYGSIGVGPTSQIAAVVFAVFTAVVW
ncbi:MAG: hypothetical protein ACRDQ0_04005, partial [Pseudonocardia sp.]